MIHVNHESGYGSIEGHGIDVFRHLFHGLVHNLGRFFVHIGALIFRSILDDVVKLVLEAYNSGHLFRLPWLNSLERSHEHLIHAQGVATLIVDNVIGIDNVAAALGHLLAIAAEDHALMNKLLERLGGGGITQVKEYLMPKSRVQKMKHSMLGTTNVKIDRHPLFINLLAECLVGILWVQKAEVIPTTTGPLWHSVGLSCVPLSFLLKITPILSASETSSRIVARLEVFHQGELERKLGLINRNWLVKSNGVVAAVLFRVNITVLNSIGKVNGKVDGNGLTPISLPRERPIAQLVCNLRPALLERLEFLCYSLFALGRSHSVEFTAVGRYTRSRKGLVRRQVALLGLDDPLHFESILGRKLKVTFVMSGHRHNSSSSVRAQHIVADPDGHLLPANGMNSIPTRENSGLFLCGSSIEIRT
mmetsp:Transcript_31925/g.93823  ORF Transcript_31925/g.93823 Transcript_31925/m.93823 type:complete len:419 (-) Transcript_31925:1231-2487(-)